MNHASSSESKLRLRARFRSATRDAILDAAATLGEAVDVMGRVQLGRRFTAVENASIVAFLKTLTGDQPAFVLPLLPPSSNETPRPSPFAD